ncbi:restriction endonuclease subunit S [Staphylococcus hominis]|uniref:restriction endonuclease subunit S n=1 Tax=Staphylococcus hominis TaxID=1290 RepID=UPI00066C1723|nr:restriction endonuclease subunit S [Staphylococcus hominis]
MTEQTNTPELRFPEFENDWKIVKLQELLSFNNGINASKNQYGVGRKFINVLDILNNNFITYNNIIGKVDVSEKVELNNKVEHGDMLFLRSSETREEVGLANTYLDNKYALFGGFVIRGKRIKEYSPLFLKETLNKPRTRYEIGVAAGGSTRFNVSQDILKNVTLYLPELEEQRKISNFFSKLDRQIELEEEKLELLEQQKRGYMQKIFSQELRFKDENGNKYPNWAVVKLKDILSERKEYASKTENYPHATLSTSGITLKSDRYNRDFLVKDKSKKYKVTIMNDICYNPANLKFGVITRNRIGSVIFSPIYITFEVNNGYSPLFIELLVTRNDFINRVRKYEEGTVYERMAVKPEDFLNYETEIPCLEEQKKIGDFLVKIDKLIENQSKKIEFLKQRKQGLLQKMFV